MKKILTIISLALTISPTFGQVFYRSELNTPLTTPWEIQYGPDSMLWVTEDGGKISRIDPVSGAKQTIYTAPDYFPGSPLENNPLCTSTAIGKGTLGMALHPDFLNPANSYVYYFYSYNYGNSSAPDTRFKIRRLKWDSGTQSVTGFTDIVTGISNGYDHFGGRLLIVTQSGTPYLFVSVGDHGMSEMNSPTCYNPQSNNPNNFAQDPATDNGKIHRYNLDGSIPSDNPISGNSFYTRGHRNPQGLMYNPTLGFIYDIEHGDRTDDEINILEKGLNYGWKNVRGYHADNNFPGEADYIANYQPDPQIANDHLMEAFYSFCHEDLPTTGNNLDWCTVAPSDGIYYGSNGIPQWTNSLLVTTLKDGSSTDMEVYQFQLNASGSIVPDTIGNPNPKRFFGEDQMLNGRLRDIAVSPDGKIIYLINNGGGTTNTDKITIYHVSEAGINEPGKIDFQLYPNPSNGQININSSQSESMLCSIYSMNGALIREVIFDNGFGSISTEDLDKGMYYVRLTNENGVGIKNFVK